MTWRTRHDVAIHESAHAVVALCLGIEVDHVVITDTSGMCYLKGDCDPRKEGVVYWAGPVAEAKWRRNGPYLSNFTWALDAQDLLIRHGDGALIEGAVKAGWPESKAAGPEFHRRSSSFLAAAQGLLSRPEIWAAVLTVSTALSSKGRLTGDEVEQLYYHGAQVPAYNP